MKTKIELVKGSVIDQDVDAIVNAANALQFAQNYKPSKKYKSNTKSK